MIGPTDLLHPSPAPHLKTFQVFLIHLPKCPIFSTTQSYVPYAALTAVLQYKKSYCHYFTAACCYGHRIIFQNYALHHSRQNHFTAQVSKQYFSPFKLLHCYTILSEGRTDEASETSTEVVPSPSPLHVYQILLMSVCLCIFRRIRN